MLAFMIALAVQAAPTPTAAPNPPVMAVAPPNGTYTYLSNLNGQSIGKTTITVARSDSPIDALTLSENSGGSYNGQSASAVAKMTLDATLLPTSYAATYSFMGPPIHAALAFNGAQANETSDRGSKSFALAARTSRFVVLDGELFAGYFLVPAQMTSWKDAPATAVAPMFGQATTLTALPPPATLLRPSGVPASDAAFYGGVIAPGAGEVNFVEWYDPGTFLVDELDMPAQHVTVVRQR